MATVAELILEQGRRRADDRLRRGDTSARMWTSLADILGQGLNRYAQEQQDAPARAQQQELRDLQLGEARAGAEARQQATEKEAGFQQAMGSGGNRAQILKALESDPEMYKRASEHFDRIDTGYKRLMGDVAAGVRAFGDTPEAALIAIDDLISKGFDERQMEQYRKAIQENPEAVRQLIDGLLANSPDETHRGMVTPKAKPEGPVKLSPGDVLYDPNTRKQITSIPDAPKMREVVVKGPNGRPVKKLVPESELMQGVEQYEAPRAEAMPSFQAKEVLGDDGKPVMANFDSRTGRYVDPSGAPIANPRPVPSAMETQDARKFKQADPILRSVEQLSEKINTQQGVLAKMSGGAQKAAAQANYNDDVAEYEALISGFTPLVARALGHTGVLTQQDVDSVKALFPKPGDSKSLRDRKIMRIKSIIGDLEAGAGGTGGADPMGIRR